MSKSEKSSTPKKSSRTNPEITEAEPMAYTPDVRPIQYPVQPWKDGKSMRQLDEVGVMIAVNQLLKAVQELQQRVS